MDNRKLILFIFLVALIFRLLFFFVYIWKEPTRSFYTIDSYTYEFPAITLLEKGKYINDCPRPLPPDFPQKCIPSKEPEIYRPPVYPLFVVAHYLIFGERKEFVILSQNLIDALKVPLIYLISKNIGINSPVPALIYAVSPSAIVFTQTFMTETLQGFFLLIVIFLLTRKRFGLAGLTSGILSLTHPLWFFFTMILPFISLIISRKLKSFILCLLGVILTITPWIARNYLIWKIPIFRPGADVFLCEIRKKMYKSEWVKSGVIPYDIDVLNRASEKFGWGIKFESEEDIKNFPFDLTKKTQIAKICRNDILKKFWKYPVDIHIAGFIRSFPPFGIAQLHYITTGDIKPSYEEITENIIPQIFSGKIAQAFKEIKEKRLKLLPFHLWFFYAVAWIIRMTSFIFALFSLVKIRKQTLILFFIFLYGTFIVTTFESAQPRRFHTVEPVVFILSAVGFRNLISLMNPPPRNIFRQKAEK